MPSEADTQRGYFITIEGIEGAGKSTAVQRICQLLNQHDIVHQRTREPGGTSYAEAIRRTLLAQSDEAVHPYTELLLMFASRAQHVHALIRPTLQAGTWVVCDRFTDASYAYQGGGRGIDVAHIAALESMVQGDMQPDATLLLDIDPMVGAQRIANRSHDRIEQEDLAFFAAAREAYLQRAQRFPERFIIIDAGQPMAKVRQAVDAAVVSIIQRLSHTSAGKE